MLLSLSNLSSDCYFSPSTCWLASCYLRRYTDEARRRIHMNSRIWNQLISPPEAQGTVKSKVILIVLLLYVHRWQLHAFWIVLLAPKRDIKCTINVRIICTVDGVLAVLNAKCNPQNTWKQLHISSDKC